MPLNTQISNATANAQANTLAALCNGGTIKIYDGTQPATSDTALSGNTLGVTLAFGATAFGAAANGVITANPIAAGVAMAEITPTFARIFKSDGITVVMDVSAGPSGANMTIGKFTAGTTVTATSFSHNVRTATAGY